MPLRYKKARKINPLKGVQYYSLPLSGENISSVILANQTEEYMQSKTFLEY